MSKLLCAAVISLLCVTPVLADDLADDIAKGKTLAENNCAICHAIGTLGPSTLRESPPFRDIATRYDEGELEDAFNEGVATEHPAMPDWKMSPDQARELASYIMSLAPYGMKKSEVVQ